MADAAETFPPGEFIKDEIEARCWTTRDLAERMGGDIDKNQCCVELLIYAPNKEVILDSDTAEGLSRAFGVSAQMFLNLDRLWRELSEEQKLLNEDETLDWAKRHQAQEEKP